MIAICREALLAIAGSAAFLGVIFLAAGAPRPVAAGVTFEVTRTDDPAAGACNPGDCSLREAIMAANASPGHDTINVPAGTYVISISGAGEEDAMTGDLDIRDSVTISGAGANATIVNGGGLDRVFHVLGEIEVAINGLTIENGLLAGAAGAGIRAEQGATLTLSSTVVRDNHVTGTSSGDVAGGVSNGQSALTIIDSWIYGNSADRGGGVFNAGSSVTTIVRTTISANEARAGGGINSYGELSLENSTVSLNLATGNTGGVLNSAPGQLTVVNTTIALNSGVGLDTFSDPPGAAPTTLVNTIVALNSVNCVGQVLSQGHNLDSDGTCGLNGPGDLPATAPLLGPLAANGGLSPTHALLQGSPAVDAADNAACPATDQRGVTRPQGGACDIGAYEATGTEPPPPDQRLVWGDHLCAGTPDVVSALAGLRHVAELAPLPQNEPCPDVGASVGVQPAGFGQQLWGDVNCNGSIDVVDALALLRFVAALPPLPQTDPCPQLGSPVLISAP